jgi:hypothetical protein
MTAYIGCEANHSVRIGRSAPGTTAGHDPTLKVRFAKPTFAMHACEEMT